MLKGLAQASAGEADRSVDLRGVYEVHKGFVWACLQRFGVPRSDLEDVLQEVLLVVHLKLSSFEPGAPMRPWLFGIALRVAANHRRLAYRRREVASEVLPDVVSTAESSPEAAVATSQARRTLSEVLDRLSLEKRAVFVMFELEGLTCEEIAAQLEVPLGTVYSRLHAARQSFAQALRQHQARREGPRR